jgi:hypothetical protein
LRLLDFAMVDVRFGQPAQSTLDIAPQPRHSA